MAMKAPNGHVLITEIADELWPDHPYRRQRVRQRMVRRGINAKGTVLVDGRWLAYVTEEQAEDIRAERPKGRVYDSIRTGRK